MSKLFYPRLAAQNIRKNWRTYLPYIITCVCAVAMYYIVFALARDPDAGEIASVFMEFGRWVIAIFAAAFLFYTNSFLMKRRKKEFGLFNILGMEKKHIGLIVLWENLYTFGISMVLGLAFGVAFFRLAHALLMRLLQFDLRYGTAINTQAMISALILFGGIFIVLLCSSLWQIGRARPIELVKGGQVGEREPKAKWAIALLGAVALAAGYWIAIATKNPVELVLLFFVAVVLVIVGTYLLFIAGGVALLKLLRKNKRYYYKSNHFIAVSGMMYRMKQNAAGLATICILSTMVLVMISSTAALYFGMEDALVARYPREIVVYCYSPSGQGFDAIDAAAQQALASRGLKAENTLAYRSISMYGRRDGAQVTVDGTYDTSQEYISLFFVPLEDYIAWSGKNITLESGQALVLPFSTPYGETSLSLLGHTFEVQEGETFVGLSGREDTDPAYTVVVRDMEVLLALGRANAGEQALRLRYQCGFDLDADVETQQAIIRDIESVGHQIDDGWAYGDSRGANRGELLAVYGGLFFLGLFLGFVFVLATVLIIYYKQVSEGYDDRQRYAIMQKVGLSRREARRSISSQILTMFFLPLGAACMHIAFAFPAITRMLKLLNLQNTGLFILTTAFSITGFALFYVAVYMLTARVYYKIVETDR